MLQAFAKPAYSSRFLFYALPVVAGCCAPGGVRVVSTDANYALAGVGRQECQVGDDEGSLLLANVPRVRLSARDADMLPLSRMGVHNTL